MSMASFGCKQTNTMEWKTVFTTIGVICCLFFGIPIKIKKQNNETEKLFQSFVHKYNKSYLTNETEYWLRYQHFQVSYVTSYLDYPCEKNANITRLFIQKTECV